MTESTVEQETHSDGGPVFWISVVLGYGIIGYGIAGAIGQEARVVPESSVKWFIGGIVLHDLIWLPIALLVGYGLQKVLPVWLRGPVSWAVGTICVLTAVASPFILGYGRRNDTPSLLPRNYALGLWAYIGVTLVIAAVWAARSYLTRDRQAS